MVAVGLLVTLEAKPGKESDLAAFLKGALPLVEEEPQTTAWFAVHLGSSRFAIFDAFPSEAGREAHLAGPVAAALMENAPSSSPATPASRRSTCWRTSCRAERRTSHERSEAQRRMRWSDRNRLAPARSRTRKWSKVVLDGVVRRRRNGGRRMRRRARCGAAVGRVGSG